MQITADYLRKQLESLTVQQNRALAVATRAAGAIELAQAMLADLEKPETDAEQK